MVSDLDKQFVYLASNKKWSEMIDFFNINKKNLNINTFIAVKKNFNNNIYYEYYSPLTYAVYNINLDVVKFLLENGADPNIQGSNLPLVTALKFKNKEKDKNDINKLIIKYLIENGADLNKLSNKPCEPKDYGMSPLAILIHDYTTKVFNRDIEIENEIMNKIHLNITLEKIEILKNYGVDLTIGDINFANTPLMYAVWTAENQIVEALLTDKVIKTKQPHIYNLPDILSLHDYVNLFNIKYLNALMCLLFNIPDPEDKRYLEIMSTLLKYGTNPNTYYPKKYKNNDGEEIIHYSTLLTHICKNGNIKLVSKLLEFKPDIDLPNNDNKKETALFSVVRENKHDIVNLLLKKKANINYLNYNGNPAIHFVKSKEMFNLLYNKGAQINYVDKNGMNILLHFINNQTLVNHLLSKFNNKNNNNNKFLIDINCQDKNGFTALIFACLKNNSELIKILLKYNPDINLVTNIEGRACIYYLLLNGSIENFKMILDKNPDLNIVDYYGYSVINASIDLDKMDFFNLLIENKNLNINFGGSNWNESEDENLEDGYYAIRSGTPIIYSCKKNKIDFCKKLLNYDKTKGPVFNLDLNLYDSTKTTALMYSIQNNNYELIKLIFDYCKINKYSLNRKLRNIDGKNIFQLAENIEMKKILIEYFKT